MKKILLLSLLVSFISSCSLLEFWDTSFEGLYKKHIHAQAENMSEMSKRLGFDRHEKIEGEVGLTTVLPSLFTGSFLAPYTLTLDGRNSETFLSHPEFLFQSIMSSGSIRAEKIGLGSYAGEAFLSFVGIASSDDLIPSDIMQIIKKYENTWLGLSQTPIAQMSPDELMGYTVSKNLIALGISDIERYATEYPIWKSKEDLGMSGSLHFWSVDINHDNILSLVKKLTKDLSGTGMTDDSITELQTSLQGVSFSGKLGFDSDNALVSYLEGEMSFSGGVIGDITIHQSEDAFTFALTSRESHTALMAHFEKNDARVSGDIVMKQDDIELGKIQGYIDFKDYMFHEILLDATSQGVTITFKHTQENGVFSGALSAVVGSFDWSGAYADKKVTGLQVSGISPFGNMSLRLAGSGSDELLRGPLLVQSGEETLLSANIGLLLSRDKFRLLFDMISETFPLHFDFYGTAKTSSSHSKLVPPVTSRLFDDMMAEIEALSPSMDTSTSDIQLPISSQ